MLHPLRRCELLLCAYADGVLAWQEIHAPLDEVLAELFAGFAHLAEEEQRFLVEVDTWRQNRLPNPLELQAVVRRSAPRRWTPDCVFAFAASALCFPGDAARSSSHLLGRLSQVLEAAQAAGCSGCAEALSDLVDEVAQVEAEAAVARMSEGEEQQLLRESLAPHLGQVDQVLLELGCNESSSRSESPRWDTSERAREREP